MREEVTRWRSRRQLHVAALGLALLTWSACGDESGGTGGSGGNGPQPPSIIDARCDGLADCGANAKDVAACKATDETGWRQAGLRGCEQAFESAFGCYAELPACTLMGCESETSSYNTCMQNATELVGDPPNGSAEAEALCAELAECYGNSLLEQYACVLGYDGTMDYANAYGCGSQAAAWQSCLQQGGCMPDCNETLAVYNQCISDASAIL
jgi:hypothetical protein